MSAVPPKSLGEALDFKVSQLLQVDLVVGVGGAVGAAWLAAKDPALLKEMLPLAIGLVGVVIGAVVAGVAVLAAFLDQPFLRKLRAINKEPVRYLRPFLFTATLGVVASLACLLLLPLVSATLWVRLPIAVIAGLSAFWTIASVVPDLHMLVQFVGLQFDATDVPDDLGNARKARAVE